MWVLSLGWEDTYEERNWQPTSYSCLENPRDRGAQQAAVHGVSRSRIQLSIYRGFIIMGDNSTQVSLQQSIELT